MAENKTPIICLDAGHGGSDSGAVNGTRKEKDDNLKLVLAVGKKLVADYVVNVKYTRTTDIFEKPSKKAQDSNGFGADLFVSFHRNSASATAKGYETLVYANTGIKKDLADKLNARMNNVGFKNRGTKVRTDLTVLKNTKAPSVLLEIGFISNTADNKIFDNKFNDIVEVIVLSIAEVMELEKKKVVVSETASSVFKNGDYNGNVKTTAKLNVRAGRGTGYSILGTLDKGKIVKVLYVLKASDGYFWGSIDYGNDVGYIRLDYVTPVN